MDIESYLIEKLWPISVNVLKRVYVYTQSKDNPEKAFRRAIKRQDDLFMQAVDVSLKDLPVDRSEYFTRKLQLLSPTAELRDLMANATKEAGLVVLDMPELIKQEGSLSDRKASYELLQSETKRGLKVALFDFKDNVVPVAAPMDEEPEQEEHVQQEEEADVSSEVELPPIAGLTLKDKQMFANPDNFESIHSNEEEPDVPNEVQPVEEPLKEQEVEMSAPVVAPEPQMETPVPENEDTETVIELLPDAKKSYFSNFY